MRNRLAMSLPPGRARRASGIHGGAAVDSSDGAPPGPPRRVPGYGPEQNWLRVTPKSVDVVVRSAGLSARNLFSATLVPLLFFAWISLLPAMLGAILALGIISETSEIIMKTTAGAAFLVTFVTLSLMTEFFSVLRVSFVPATDPTTVRLVRGWRISRAPIATVSAVTVIEHRERDVPDDPSSGIPLGIGLALHHPDGSVWTSTGIPERLLDGVISRVPRPDCQALARQLADVLGPVGIPVEHEYQLHERRSLPWNSGGSASANTGGF
ncbi:hypothetical protein [Actinomadura rayongensis]|uniref:Uncharacterized protein n=1 Tax=Actinomadura rayongensis TaxID=1429076 RepID=A0A6I4WG58_9ACTN|nr:hypothetical protein [Actinomadura rayongensis]MXQ65572.1 hypothetical protein [Actinomadura rayongensis]